MDEAKKTSPFNALDVVFLVLLFLAQVGIVFVVRSRGGFAVSDDDAARVVISQQFVQSPSLDPSKTSWLPLPFLFTGTLMALAGATLETARAASLLGAVVGSGLLYVSGRILGASRPAAVLATLVAALLPLAAHLAAATVPEYPTAACVVFAASTLYRRSAAAHSVAILRLLGACSLFVACGSRYEAWPAAVAFAAVSLLDASRGLARLANLSAACVAFAFPLSWLIHGAHNHQDALFFVERVVGYKLALGGAESLGEAIFTYPRALLLAEPEVVLACLLATVVYASHRPPGARSLLAPMSVLLALVVGLVVGGVRGGVPTHHPERALLSCYLIAPLLVASYCSSHSLRARVLPATALGGLLGTVLHLALPSVTDPYLDRSDEELVGRRLRASHHGERVALALPNYGYFTVMAAAGDPERFEILKSHDPRAAGSESPWLERLSKFREKGGCLWVSSRELSFESAIILFETERLALFHDQRCQTAKGPSR